MNWASAGVTAQIDRLILEEGYGCEVEMVTGDTVPTFTSMNEKGSPDVAPELWMNAIKDQLDAAVAAVEQAAIQASCETRRLVGQQAVAFTAAALPLCRPV